MSGRSNACSELTKFWIESRHGFLVTENVPVPVPGGWSDIDVIAVNPSLSSALLPDGRAVAPRLIIEAKDEHDFDPTGKAFGKMLKSDVAKFGSNIFIPKGAKGAVKFSMLREAHYQIAYRHFESEEFDRVFVVHAIDPAVLSELAPLFAACRIHCLTIHDVVRDLVKWYRQHPCPTTLRHSLMGDVWHLLVGYCGLDLTS